MQHKSLACPIYLRTGKFSLFTLDISCNTEFCAAHHTASYCQVIVIYPACVAVLTVIMVSVNVYTFRQTNPKSLNSLIDYFCLYDLRWHLFDAICASVIDINNTIFLIGRTHCDIWNRSGIATF